MNTLEKLNITLSDLEKEVENIKSINRLITEIEKTNKTSMCSIDKINDGISEIKLLEVNFKKHIEDETNNLEIQNQRINSLSEKQIEFSLKQNEFYKSSLSAQATLEEKLLNQIQTLKSENTRTLLELEKIMASKLERNKSDIEVELRKLTVLMDEHFAETKKTSIAEQKTNRIILGFVVVLILVNIGIGFIK